MNACMHDYDKEQRKHGVRLKFYNIGVVTTPFGEDYGFIRTCNKGSIKFSKFSTTSEYLSGDGSTPILTIFVG